MLNPFTKRFALAAISAVFVLQLQASGHADNTKPKVLGRDIDGTPLKMKSPVEKNANPTGSANSGSPTKPQLGDSCHTSDPNHICLALKYVVYKDKSGAPTAGSDVAQSNLNGMNKIWGQCNISFQIDQYDAADPVHYGLSYTPANDSELTDIRNAFSDDNKLVVVTTGTWDRTGSLGNTGANAWTSMPGSPPYGAILEKPVAMYPNIIGHELGHYLNLDHVSDNTDLMSPIVYDNSNVLTQSQCDTARAAAVAQWPKMLR